VRSNARIIVYGGRSELKATLEAIQSGATVYLDDKVNATTFLKSLEMAADGFVTLSVTVLGEPGQGEPGRKQAAAVEEAPSAPGAASASAAISAPLAPPATSCATAPAMQPAPAHLTPEALAARRPTPPFSPREASILQLLREGAPNKLIARQLSLTEATVKVHLKSILRKIRVNNRTQAAVWAMEQDALFAAQLNGRAK
jgi:DNA-binding NarL/FixJ family response regulator